MLESFLKVTVMDGASWMSTGRVFHKDGAATVTARASDIIAEKLN